jgi:hypothetical protein
MKLATARQLASVLKQQRAKAGLKSHPPKVTRPLDPASHSPARAPYHGKSIPAFI